VNVRERKGHVNEDYHYRRTSYQANRDRPHSLTRLLHKSAQFYSSCGVTARDENQAIPNDRFSPNRVGLDHLSFGVANRAELLKAAALFDENGVEHGEVRDLPPFGITILSFNDPDGIQCELTAPLE